MSNLNEGFTDTSTNHFLTALNYVPSHSNVTTGASQWFKPQSYEVVLDADQRAEEAAVASDAIAALEKSRKLKSAFSTQKPSLALGGIAAAKAAAMRDNK